jgi:hypothetical protein
MNRRRRRSDVGGWRDRSRCCRRGRGLGGSAVGEELRVDGGLAGVELQGDGIAEGDVSPVYTLTLDVGAPTVFWGGIGEQEVDAAGSARQEGLQVEFVESEIAEGAVLEPVVEFHGIGDHREAFGEGDFGIGIRGGEGDDEVIADGDPESGLGDGGIDQDIVEDVTGAVDEPDAVGVAIAALLEDVAGFLGAEIGVEGASVCTPLLSV